MKRAIDIFFPQTCCNHKTLFCALSDCKFHADIEIRAEKRNTLSICQVSEYGNECGVRNAKFSELVEIIFILGAVRPLHIS